MADAFCGAGIVTLGARSAGWAVRCCCFCCVCVLCVVIWGRLALCFSLSLRRTHPEHPKKTPKTNT